MSGDGWRTIAAGAARGEPRIEARPSSDFEDQIADAARRDAEAARQLSQAEIAAQRDRLATMARHALEELRRLPQENRSKRQRVDRAIREMRGV